MATRLRVGRGIGQTETESAIELWQGVKQRSGCDQPPPLLSDGWGGHREAIIAVFGKVPDYRGRGRPPKKKRPQTGWQYAQMVKQRENGRVVGIEYRPIYGNGDELLTHTSYVERTNLTSRHMNGRLVRKTLGFSKRVAMLRAACAWEDMIYNWARSVKTLRVEVNDGIQRWQQHSPAMTAGLTDHIWSIEEILTLVPTPANSL